VGALIRGVRVHQRGGGRIHVYRGPASRGEYSCVLFVGEGPDDGFTGHYTYLSPAEALRLSEVLTFAVEMSRESWEREMLASDRKNGRRRR
jgi:hypothetical protein